MSGSEPTHSDIMARLGELKGQVDTLTLLVSQKREDLNTAFTLIRSLEQSIPDKTKVDEIEKRMRVIEGQIAKWVGICLACSFLFPVTLKLLTSPHSARTATSLFSWITPTDSAASTWSTPKPGR
jgi:hypothetical protein